MIGTYPHMKIERLEKRINELEKYVHYLEMKIYPIDKTEKYVSNKVEGEGPMGYYGDV